MARLIILEVMNVGKLMQVQHQKQNRKKHRKKKWRTIYLSKKKAMKDYSYEHDNLRKLMWINAWASVANAITCPDSKIATTWADKALKDFDERFPTITHLIVEF